MAGCVGRFCSRVFGTGADVLPDSDRKLFLEVVNNNMRGEDQYTDNSAFLNDLNSFLKNGVWPMDVTKKRQHYHNLDLLISAQAKVRRLDHYLNRSSLFNAAAAGRGGRRRHKSRRRKTQRRKTHRRRQ